MRIIASLLACIGSCAVLAADSPAVLVTRGHAHNDYEHARPLLDALDKGFCSIEADIFLVDGQLLVGHSRSALKPQRTLQALYLDPLRQRVQANHGRVYPDGPTIILLIDVKTEAEPTYLSLREVLKNYAEMLTVFHEDRIEPKAISVIISGERARKLMEAEKTRLAAYDGRLEDLDQPSSPSFVPLVSASWPFHWRGDGPMPPEEQSKLRELVNEAHTQKRQIRFWGGPDIRAFWEVQYQCGVDWINTDNLRGLHEFMAAKAQSDKP